MAKDKDSDDGAESPAKRRLEAVAATIGALLALATLGMILWDGFTGGDAPPEIVLEQVRVVEQAGGFLVEIEALNRGDRTATAVEVVGELRRGEEVVEESRASFDYVPSRSSREGGLFFRADPRQLPLTLRATGYAEP